MTMRRFCHYNFMRAAHGSADERYWLGMLPRTEDYTTVPPLLQWLYA